MPVLIGKFVCLLGCYLLGIVGGVFLHELGHALVALLVTRQRVGMEVGSAGKRGGLRLGRLDLTLRSRGLRYGATRYERATESRQVQILVALGGPLASGLACALFAWMMVGSVLGSWGWVAWLGLAVANFRILIVSVWPIEYRPDGDDGETWLSDGLDVWRLLTRK